MLKISKEFRKGILFLRLKGVLNKNTINILQDEVTNIIEKVGIYNIVFNLSSLEQIDIEGVKKLFMLYNLCRKNDGISMLCGVSKSLNKVLNSNKISYMFQIKNELDAIRLVRI